MNLLSLSILVGSVLLAGVFWSQQQTETKGVQHKGLPLKRFRVEVQALQSQGDAERLIGRLSELVEASEIQHQIDGRGVCPWYYEQLANALNATERYVDELAILQRFAAQSHPKHKSTTVVLQRLQAARSAAVTRGRRRIEEELMLRAAQS